MLAHATIVVGGVQFDHDGHIEGLLARTPIEGGLRFEGLVEFGLGRIGDLRRLIPGLVTSESPFLGDWKESSRRFWLRPSVSLAIRALPRRPGRPLRHATVIRSL
jgi:hypothetical protein